MDNYSVLMSVYYKDNPLWLKESIESVLNQTVKTNDFVIIKDGNLTDELDKVIEEYKQKYSSIINVKALDENVGLGRALEIGVLECKNELIARIDSDDFSTNDRCEKQLKEFEADCELDIVGAKHIEFIDDIENVVAYKDLPVDDEEIKAYAKRRNPFSHSAVMFKKSSVLKAGNYRQYYYLEDYDLWVRMIQTGCKTKNIDEYLSYVRVNKDLYKRRGGIKYLKSILKFKRELYKNGFYSLKDFVISSSCHIVVCLVPGCIRKIIYNKFLRKNK